MSDHQQSGRRGFIKTVAAGVGLQSAVGQTPQAREVTAHTRSYAERIKYPRTFSGRQLAQIGFPLGGIGTGSISLGGRGQLRDWEIYNRPDKGRSPEYAFA